MSKSPPTSREVRSTLHAAEEDWALVRLHRSIRRSDDIEGFVVGVGDKWVLLALLDDLLILNGYVAVRLDDVEKVRRRGGPDSMVGRALASRGQWPPVRADVRLDGKTTELLQSAAEQWPVVTLHLEHEDPTDCFVGRPVDYTTRSVDWLDISPEAEWCDNVVKHPLSQVTRVDFGGLYEEALVAVGGPPPR